MSLNMRLQATFATRQAAVPSVPERIETNIKDKCTRGQPEEDSKQAKKKALVLEENQAAILVKLLPV
jgi:hypothetical protein